MWIHNVGKGTFDLHELILCLSEDVLSMLLCSHIVNKHRCPLITIIKYDLRLGNRVIDLI